MGLISGFANSVAETFGPLLNLFNSPIPYRGQDFKEGFVIIELDKNFAQDFTSDWNNFLSTFDAASGTQFDPGLRGSNMPTEMFPFGGKQKLVKEYYPGNPEPAIQVLGPQENNIKVKGQFRDRKLASEDRQENYGSSYTLAIALDDLRKRGNLLLIRLGEYSVYAYLEEAVFNLRSLGRIDYELDFSISGDSVPVNGKFVDPATALPLGPNVNLMAAAAAFETANLKVPDTMPLNLLGEINSAVGAVASAVSALTKFVEGIVTSVENVERLYERALGLIKNANASIVSLRRRMSTLALYSGTARVRGSTAISESKRIINATHIYEVIHSPSRVISNKTDADKADQASRSEKYTAVEATKAAVRNQKGSESLESLLNAMRVQFEALARTVPRATYRVKDGDNLQVIAMKYYKDASLWEKIYSHNKLTSTVLTSGTLLEIPRQ